MILSFHGAAREVGRAACLVEEDKKRIILDYGIKVSEEQNILPMPVQGILDAAIISHAHLDHSGAVPMLFNTSEQPVYMTPPSVPMIDLLVKDSIKVNNLKGLLPIFTQTHVKSMMRNIKQVGYDQPAQIGNVDFKFQDAGHIIGAGCIDLQFSDTHLIYTGDIKFEETRLTKAAYDGYKKVDVMVIESTYGNREHPPRKEIEKSFIDACVEKCDEGGNVLVPAFAVGRTQEIIEILNSNGFGYPIYMDGMSKAAAEIMLDQPEYIRDYDEFYKAMKECRWIQSPGQRKDALKEPSVMVSTAGMLTGGPSLDYLFKMREKKNQAVFFTGYQPEETPGYRLLHERRLFYEEFDLNYNSFDIRYFDFSAHSDRTELFDFIKKVNPRLCLLQHGEESQALSLAQKIDDELKVQTVVPKFGEKVNTEDYI